MNNWRHTLDDAFTAMAEALPKLLQNKMEQYLAPQQRWTDILMVLDQEHRRVDPKWYHEGDPGVQLRMVTERLGNIGYPFDDSTRETSARGQMLRIVRNGYAHWESVSAFEVLRVFDDIEHVLERVGDNQAHRRLMHLRQSTGLSRLLIEPEPVRPRTAVPTEDSAPGLNEQETATTLQAARLERKEAQGGTPELAHALGSERQPYQPYRVVQQGHPEDLKVRLGSIRRQKVRSVIQDVAESQWPVMLAPLVKDIGRSFGFQRLGKSPREKIEHQVRSMVSQGLLHVSEDGAVWPSTEAEHHWHGFRPDPDQHRNWDEIPAREIRHAANALREAQNDTSSFDVVRLTAAEFGFQRLTPAIRAHFGTALEGNLTP